MNQFQIYFVEHQTELRMVSFAGLILIFAGLEIIWPRRTADEQSKFRRLNNLTLLFVNFIAVRYLVPWATLDVALIAAERDFGLLNIISVPMFLSVILTIVIFDFLIYIQHIIFHKLSFLWRIHRVHHTDLEFDVTTAIRFHPFEIILSMFYKLIAVYLIGPLAFAIILYEIILNAAALFGHSNIMLSTKFDSALRTLFVTPDMHRIHHSVIRNETDSNYGNVFSIWDKVFNTYRALPEAGYDDMVIGLDKFRQPSSGQVLQLLKNPFTTGR
ncbi:MAG TPA: sterol desaturase family protein [Thiotrichaceae bacterium]|jgi:sterol desaturase/sphingolipid hydroxylase (fatty acid hydroxylase superfamily)|nr:sterol desaturase family protein [Thiotrichaceae bacterium]HIM08925.1 sterol desaturase family protein [Gammaproteobacteria bacterium]